jgi:hypothetical protein
VQVPRLTGAQKEALRLYNALAHSDRLRMDIMLAPGDIQLLSNHTQLHTRSAFTDHEVIVSLYLSLAQQPHPAAHALRVHRPRGDPAPLECTLISIFQSTSMKERHAPLAWPVLWVSCCWTQLSR